MAFDPDIFMGLQLKWILKSYQPFSTVENQYFEDLLGYLKNDITVAKTKGTISANKVGNFS